MNILYICLDEGTLSLYKIIAKSFTTYTALGLVGYGRCAIQPVSLVANQDA